MTKTRIRSTLLDKHRVQAEAEKLNITTVAGFERYFYHHYQHDNSAREGTPTHWI